MYDPRERAGSIELCTVTVKEILRTLRRVDDDIILAVAGRDLELGDAHSCVCGWIVREKVARLRNVGASEVDERGYADVMRDCAAHFGGSEEEWDKIFVGVVQPDKVPVIERAFVHRYAEAAEGRRIPLPGALGSYSSRDVKSEMAAVE